LSVFLISKKSQRCSETPNRLQPWSAIQRIHFCWYIYRPSILRHNTLFV